MYYFRSVAVSSNATTSDSVVKMDPDSQSICIEYKNSDVNTENAPSEISNSSETVKLEPSDDTDNDNVNDTTVKTEPLCNSQESSNIGKSEKIILLFCIITLELYITQLFSSTFLNLFTFL